MDVSAGGDATQVYELRPSARGWLYLYGLPLVLILGSLWWVFGHGGPKRGLFSAGMGLVLLALNGVRETRIERTGSRLVLVKPFGRKSEHAASEVGLVRPDILQVGPSRLQLSMIRDSARLLELLPPEKRPS